MPHQIPLDLAPNPDFSFDNFVLGVSNQAAVSLVTAWPLWPSPLLLLVGPQGSGKTHLGTAWAQRAGAVLCSVDGYDSDRPVAKNSRFFVDDADKMPETDLFTLMNAALNGRIDGLLLSAKMLPQAWETRLPDLRSRLTNTSVAEIDDHEDDILESIIRKLFDDHGRSVKADVVTYLMKNHDRSVNAMRAVIADLDLAAREAKRDITRAFVAQALKA